MSVIINISVTLKLKWNSFPLHKFNIIRCNWMKLARKSWKCYLLLMAPSFSCSFLSSSKDNFVTLSSTSESLPCLFSSLWARVFLAFSRIFADLTTSGDSGLKVENSLGRLSIDPLSLFSDLTRSQTGYTRSTLMLFTSDILTSVSCFMREEDVSGACSGWAGWHMLDMYGAQGSMITFFKPISL